MAICPICESPKATAGVMVRSGVQHSSVRPHDKVTRDRCLGGEQIKKARRSAPFAGEGARTTKQRSLQQRAFLLYVLLDDAGGGYLVPGLQLQQADALGRAAGLADLPRVNADDLAVVADEHGF